MEITTFQNLPEHSNIRYLEHIYECLKDESKLMNRKNNLYHSITLVSIRYNNISRGTVDFGAWKIGHSSTFG